MLTNFAKTFRSSPSVDSFNFTASKGTPTDTIFINLSYSAWLGAGLASVFTDSSDFSLSGSFCSVFSVGFTSGVGFVSTSGFTFGSACIPLTSGIDESWNLNI